MKGIDNIGNTTRDFNKKKWDLLVDRINKFNLVRSKKIIMLYWILKL